MGDIGIGILDRVVTDRSYICKDPDPEYYVHDSGIRTGDKASEGGSDQDNDLKMNCLAGNLR
jgi:hypothetical protein